MANITKNSDLQYIARQAMDILLRNNDNNIKENLTTGNGSLSKTVMLECSIAFLKAYQMYASKPVREEPSLFGKLFGNATEVITHNLPFDNPMSKLFDKFALENRVDGTHKLLTRKDSPLVLESAIIAKHVYGNRPTQLIGEWRKVNTAIWNVRYSDDTGLVSALYRRKDENNTDEYIYAFAGTDITNIEDLKTDVLQEWIDTPQYGSALKNAKIISKFVGKHKLTFVGHSLGGGEAAYCAMNIPNRRAITFNPMGVKTDKKVDWNIDAYIMVNDWLNLIQDTGIIPKANGVKHYIEDNSIQYIESHDIDSVINALGALRH